MKKSFLMVVLIVLTVVSSAFAQESDGSTTIYVRQTDTTAGVRLNLNGTVAEAKLWPKQDVSLGFAGGGIVESVLVKEGDTVRKGEVLAVIKGSENYRQQYAEAELNLAAAQDELKSLNDSWAVEKAAVTGQLVEARKTLDKANDTFADYDTPDYRTRLDNANQAYTDKWEDVEDAKDLVDKVSELDETSSRRRTVEDDYKKALQDYEELKRAYNLLLNNKNAAEAAVKAAEADVENLERELEELTDGPKQTKLDVINQKIAAAEAQKEAAMKNIETLQIIAPFDGIVVTMDLTAGELVSAAKPVIVLADDSAQILKTVDLSETDMSGVAVGNRVRVVFDAYSEYELYGTVTKVTNWAGAYLGDVVFPVEITLDPNNLPLLWGMTASVYF